MEGGIARQFCFLHDLLGKREVLMSLGIAAFYCRINSKTDALIDHNFNKRFLTKHYKFLNNYIYTNNFF